MATLWCRRGGRRNGPLLMVLHGLGATADALTPLLRAAERRWPGPWAAPDLRGHGRSPYARRYSFGQHAVDVAELIGSDDPVYVLGHSMGGVIALVLASGWFGVPVTSVLALSVKVRWTSGEIDALPSMAAKPARVFPTRELAAERYLRVSGLAAVAGVEGPAVESGLRKVNEGWTLAADPRSVAVGAPDMAGLLSAAMVPVTLAAGDADPLVSPADLLALDPAAVILPGVGHLAPAQAPDTVLELLAPLKAEACRG